MSKLGMSSLLLTSFLVFVLGTIVVLAADAVKGDSPDTMNIYSYVMKDIDGKSVSLEQYKGKVLLIVNVASKCGYTPQYKTLEQIYEKYKDRGFVILGFPANNFRSQEPGTDAEIKQFCTVNYNVQFPMFSKISVIGDDIHPLYRYLTSKESDPEFSGRIRWNFEKFLIDRKGKIIARFPSATPPDDITVISAIDKALKPE